LQREKIALEESLKALSLSQHRNDGYEAGLQTEKELLTTGELQADDSSISTELSDSLVTVKYIHIFC